MRLYAALHVPEWQRKDMKAADRTTVTESLGAWVVERDTAAAAAVPPHERQLTRIDAERWMRTQRAERDRAEAELIALGGGTQRDTEPPAGLPSSASGRLRWRPSTS